MLPSQARTCLARRRRCLGVVRLALVLVVATLLVGGLLAVLLVALLLVLLAALLVALVAVFLVALLLGLRLLARSTVGDQVHHSQDRDRVVGMRL